jgi:hypothetical protein
MLPGACIAHLGFYKKKWSGRKEISYFEQMGKNDLARTTPPPPSSPQKHNSNIIHDIEGVHYWNHPDWKYPETLANEKIRYIEYINYTILT